MPSLVVACSFMAKYPETITSKIILINCVGGKWDLWRLSLWHADLLGGRGVCAHRWDRPSGSVLWREAAEAYSGLFRCSVDWQLKATRNRSAKAPEFWGRVTAVHMGHITENYALHHSTTSKWGQREGKSRINVHDFQYKNVREKLMRNYICYPVL